MLELDHKECWAPKNWCFWTLKKSLESPLNCKEIQAVSPKGNQTWIFIGRTDAYAEVLIHWPPDKKSWLIRKDLDAGRGWGQEEKGTTEDEMAEWHHRLNGQEFEQTLGDGEGQGTLACCSSWVAKSQMQLSNWAAPWCLVHTEVSARNGRYHDWPSSYCCSCYSIHYTD